MTNTITSLAAREQLTDSIREAQHSRRCADVRGQRRVKLALPRRVGAARPALTSPASLDRPRLEPRAWRLPETLISWLLARARIAGTATDAVLPFAISLKTPSPATSAGDAQLEYSRAKLAQSPGLTPPAQLRSAAPSAPASSSVSSRQPTSPTAHRELSPHLLLSDSGSHPESPAPVVQHHRRAMPSPSA